MVTTIEISDELKEKIASFGSKNEPDEKIIERIYDMAANEQVRRFLMSDEDCISIAEARKELNEKWPRSK